MEKYVTWYGLLLKTWVRRKSSWIQLAGMILVVLLIAGIRIPDSNNTVIGLCNQDSGLASDVTDSLLSSKSVFQFQLYEEEEELKEAVIRGEVETGFIFEEGLSKKLEQGKKKNLITVITTPLTTKGAVAKETVFAAFLERYSQEILLEQEEQVFGKESKEISEALLEKNQEYLKSDELFRVDFEEIAAHTGEGEEKTETFPVRGMAVLLIFVMILIEHGKKFEQKECAVEKALTGSERICFEFLRYVSAATIPAVAGVVLVMGTGQGTFIGKEILGILLFVAALGIWMILVGKLFRNGTTYASWIMTLILANLLLCPLFVNVGEYVPALGYLNCVFPVGIYLKLF